MASVFLRKSRSKFWVACFYDPNGKRVQRSTGCRNEEEAKALADRLERPWIVAKARKCRVRLSEELGELKTSGSLGKPKIIASSSSFTGLPDEADRMIRESLTPMDRRGGGSSRIQAAVVPLAQLESAGRKRVVLPSQRAAWLVAWQALGRVLLEESDKGGIEHLLRQAEDALKIARNDAALERKETTNEQNLYWWIACFYKVHGRVASVPEMDANLSDFISKTTLKRILSQWEFALKRLPDHFEFECNSPKTGLAIAEYFGSKADFLSSKFIYARIGHQKLHKRNRL